MQFKTESERKTHAQARLIPQNLWGMVFNDKLLLPELPLFSTPIQSLLSTPELLQSQLRNEAAWVCIAVSNNRATAEELAQAAKLLDLALTDVLFLASSLGNLRLAQNALATLGQVEAFGIISDKNHRAYRSAAANGQLEMLQYFETLAPELATQIIQAVNYSAYSKASENGHLNVLKHLEAKKPDLIFEMIKANECQAYRSACANAQFDIVRYLESKSDLLTYQMIKANNFGAYSVAARYNQVEILKHLEDTAPEFIAQMIQVNNYAPFHSATENEHHGVVNHLLSHPICFAFAEIHEQEYHHWVHPFITNKITELKNRQQTHQSADANSPFDLTNYNEIRLCIYITRNLIRRNQSNLAEDLRFLLRIPALRAIAHREITRHCSNELIRLALTTGNREAAAILMEIPAVRVLAEHNNFYRHEARGEMDLRAIAEDKESSMRALTTGELKRLEAARHCYESQINQVGVRQILENLRQTLMLRYQQNPAKINIHDEEIILPATWSDFQRLGLQGQAYQDALQAYYQHKDHSAWRFLAKPNPWLAANASYVRFDKQNRWLRWSDFEGYQELITLLYCAVIDPNSPPTDDFTFEARLVQFIDELAHIGRAHNWDKKRILPDGTEIPYDDLEGDKPSCFSGMKRRLFQSVVGHSLFKMLTLDDIKVELRSFLIQHFSQLVTVENQVKLKDVLEEYIVHLKTTEHTAVLSELDITEQQLTNFLQSLEKRYGTQFKEDPGLTSYITNELSQKDARGQFAKFPHALKFAGLANLLDLLTKRIADQQKSIPPSEPKLKRSLSANSLFRQK